MEPVKVTSDDLQVFHSGDYVSFLKAHNDDEWDDLSPEEMEEAEAWGLGMYWPIEPYIYRKSFELVQY